LSGHSWQDTALVLAAHGERRPAAGNRSLIAHAAALAARKKFACVVAGVMEGAPALEAALAEVEASGADCALIFPFFMSDGTIVRQLLPRRIAECHVRTPTIMLPPLGLEPRLLALLSNRVLAAAREAGFKPSASRLLVVGHGSRLGGASALATRRVASLLEATGVFAAVDVAFLEEPPLLANQLAIDRQPVVVLGFFSGEGVHAWQDVPAAIEATGAQAVYTGPIGADPHIPDVILASVAHWRGTRHHDFS
jgi:sirohydrochlorin ferrochelatase